MTKRQSISTEVRITNKKTGGQKGVKEARFDLIPPGPMWELARVYGRGAAKYEDRNWERGYNWGLSYGAMQRHLVAFWGGEYNDEETGLPHLAHAMWHCCTLMQFQENFPEMDDRSKLRAGREEE